MRILARAKMEYLTLSSQKKFEKCHQEKKCLEKTFFAAEKKTQNIGKMMANMNYHLQMRQCLTLGNHRMKQMCKNVAKKSRKTELYSSVSHGKKKLDLMRQSFEKLKKRIETRETKKKKKKGRKPVDEEEKSATLSPQVAELVAQEEREAEKSGEKSDENESVDSFLSNRHQKDQEGLEAWARTQVSHSSHDSSHHSIHEIHHIQSVEDLCSRNMRVKYGRKMHQMSKSLAKESLKCHSVECGEHYEAAIDDIVRQLKERKQVCF